MMSLWVSEISQYRLGLPQVAGIHVDLLLPSGTSCFLAIFSWTHQKHKKAGPNTHHHCVFLLATVRHMIKGVQSPRIGKCTSSINGRNYKYGREQGDRAR